MTGAPLEEVLELRGLRLRILPVKERCLFAARRFSPGEVLLEQSPYVAVLNSYKEKRCDSCYKEVSTCRRCALCKSVWYCSVPCQKREWSIHKIECKCLVTLMEEKSRELTPSLRLMLRLLIKRLLQKDKTVLASAMDNYEVVEALPTHSTDVPEQQLLLYAQMANLVKLTCTFEVEDIKDITQNFCRFACNAHTICDHELRPLGVGLYPVISIINHSCRPNCILLFDGKEASVRAIEYIEQGTELTLSYVELGDNTATRCKNLREQYFFDCDCVQCARQDDFLLEEDPGKVVCQACGKKHDKLTVLGRVEDSNVACREALDLLSDGNFPEARRLFERLDQLQAQIFLQDSLHRIRTYENLSKVCMSMEDWPYALINSQRALSAYQRVYQPYHPLLGLQHYTSGKLEWFLGKTVDAVKSYRQALTILKVTHGSHTSLVQDLMAAFDEAQAEALFLERAQQ